MCYLSWYLCKIGVTRLLQLRTLTFHRVSTVPKAADGLSQMSRLPARPSDSGFAQQFWKNTPPEKLEVLCVCVFPTVTDEPCGGSSLRSLFQLHDGILTFGCPSQKLQKCIADQSLRSVCYLTPVKSDLCSSSMACVCPLTCACHDLVFLCSRVFWTKHSGHQFFS